LPITGVANLPVSQVDAIGGAPAEELVRGELIGAAGKLGKVSVYVPGPASVVQVWSLRTEDIVFEMVKSIFP
jgi:hypothetical protein